MLRELDPAKVAYLIGFLAGDGNFCGGYGRRQDRLSVTTTDEELVEWINSHIIDFDTSKPRLKNNEALGIMAKLPAYVKTFPSSFGPSFEHYGILSLKSGRVIQNISTRDMRHWLRGFLDSDGCITYGFRKGRSGGGDRLVGKVVFTHVSDTLLEQVQEFLRGELDIESKIADKTGENCKTLSFSKLSDMKRFGDYVYEDVSSVVVSRKYETFKAFSDTLLGPVMRGETYPDEFKHSEANHKLLGSFSKYVFISENGIEYLSAELAQEDYPEVSKKAIHRRCSQGNKGWSRRLKTEEEKQEYANYVKAKTNDAFTEWLADNEGFYG